MSEARRIKSRAGCQQCKRRRVKCDLSSPSCTQCKRQMLQCPGYQKPLKWRDESKTLRQSQVLTQQSYRSASKDEVLTSTLPVDDEASVLIHHYFTKICKIAGCFDSDLNPFRKLASTMMSYSRPVYLLLQASSAAHLSRQVPEMRIKALQLQSEAFAAVRDDISKVQGPRQPRHNIVTDELMISSIIAGLTSAWYDVNDVGGSHVLGGQVLLYLWLQPQRKRLQYQQTFILGAFVYWLTISSFVVGDAERSYQYQDNLLKTVNELDISHDFVDDTAVPDALRRIFPHPLAGFSIPLLVMVGKVGSLCRMQQTSGSSNNVAFTDLQERKAQALELELLDKAQVHLPNFADPMDPLTTIDEILSVGEAYQCAGLLQLYATFPSLLQRQFARNYTDNLAAQVPSLEAEMEAMVTNSEGRYTAQQHNWLRAFAFHICNILVSVPSNSGTRVLQGLPVIIASTWLVNPETSSRELTDPDTIVEHSRLFLCTSTKKTEYWRNQVRLGLRLHGEVVGLEQVSRIINIVEEIWRLDNEGYKKCDWMAVVASKGMQTLYG
ncbi:fungal-specific transcription factor domain-containing protein [Calycina marina]|uniref:Fungal-specific transcription factor domain-containing protein n=1 Tax=Calycina marina TaxID=1763456 RepID=A0A9P7YY35_9HELO|nr:fungal-specific transcription factor domain-containing protein [Calycina marina]